MIRKIGCFSISDRCALSGLHSLRSWIWFTKHSATASFSQQLCTNVHGLLPCLVCNLLKMHTSSSATELLPEPFMHEQTIAGPIEFTGVGLHTGENATLRILPAPAGKGIVFR